MINNNSKLALIILDGWGHGKDPKRSAISQAKTPFVDSLYSKLPNAELITFGESVGLPEGQMGNSEVGHLNIGAGRVVYQELARINKSFRENEFEKNNVFQETIAYAKNNNKPLHLIGLISDGGVHSHISHLIGLCNILKDEEIQVKIHGFLDGRDTDPNGGIKYIHELENTISDADNIELISLIGRYYAMDRDLRWERISKAYHLICHGKGESTNDFLSSLENQYGDGITDEFMIPLIKSNINEEDLISESDAVLFFNFRTDRPRQLTTALTQENFEDQAMYKMKLHFCTMTEYNKSYEDIHIIFQKEDLKNTLGEILEKHNKSQVRIAETEKYPHVTFFFNGGREEPFKGEHRILVNSPKVATYDLQPEMSADEVTYLLNKYIDKSLPDFICLNYANADMVGHTGIMNAAIKAIESVDSNLEKVVNNLDRHHYSYIIIADHGNADMIINDDGTPNTAHTTNMVPVFIGGPEITKQSHLARNGKLGDIATTAMSIMGIEAPVEMTGEILIESYPSK